MYSRHRFALCARNNETRAESGPALGEKSNMALVNTLGFIATVIVNALANALPINGMTTGEISDAYPNLFTPPGFTFAVWGVIYLALAAFVLYQLGVLGDSRERVMSARSRVGWWFAVSCAANIGWILLWHHQMVAMSVVVMIVLLASLAAIWRSLRIGSELSGRARAFGAVPFSIYLGWISVATIANVSALLVDLGWNGFGLSEQLWAVIMIVVALALTSWFVLSQRDAAFGLVVAWAFTGILVKHLTVFESSYMGLVVAAAASIAAIAIEVIISLSRKPSR